MALAKSPFLPLPRELRNMVYQHLLTQTFTILNPGTAELHNFLPLYRRTRLAILVVSRSTYEEAKPALYRHGRFRFNAIAAGSPPLYTTLHRIPELEMLQNITIRLDVKKAVSLGYENKRQCIGSVAAVVTHFAGLESNSQRKRCVVEIKFVSEFNSAKQYMTFMRVFNDAFGRLTKFETAELKIEYLRKDPGSQALLYDDNLFDGLAVTLGPAKRFGQEGDIHLEYHPRRW